MAEWTTVRLPKKMMEEVEKFLKTGKARKAGYTSRTQLVVTAVRNLLEKYSN